MSRDQMLLVSAGVGVAGAGEGGRGKGDGRLQTSLAPGLQAEGPKVINDRAIPTLPGI